MPAIYPHLAARIFNTPLLIHPQKLDAMIAAVGQRLLGQPVASNAHAAPEAFSTRPTAQAGEPYAVHDGVAVINIFGALAQDGLKVTHIFAGAHKIDGNPYEPLPASVRADWQAEIDGLYTEFVQAVAAYRGLSFDAVRNTQARLFRGHAAQASGLANRVGTTDAVIAELASRRNAPKVFLPATHQATAVTPKVNRMMSHATHQTTHYASAATSQEAQAEALAMQVLQSAGFATPTKAAPVPAATTAEDLADRMVADYRRIILGEVA